MGCRIGHNCEKNRLMWMHIAITLVIIALTYCNPLVATWQCHLILGSLGSMDPSQQGALLQTIGLNPRKIATFKNLQLSNSQLKTEIFGIYQFLGFQRYTKIVKADGTQETNKHELAFERVSCPSESRVCHSIADWDWLVFKRILLRILFFLQSYIHQMPYILEN